jgi:hypothetical protein
MAGLSAWRGLATSAGNGLVAQRGSETNRAHVTPTKHN